MADVFPPVLDSESTVLPPIVGLEGQVFTQRVVGFPTIPAPLVDNGYVYVDLIQSSAHIFEPFTNSYEIFPELVPTTSTVMGVRVVHGNDPSYAVTSAIYNTSYVAQPMILHEGEVVTSALASTSQVYLPGIDIGEIVVETELEPSTSQVFLPGILSMWGINTDLVYESTVFQPRVEHSGNIYTSAIPSTSYIYRPFIRTQRDFPLLIKQAGANREPTMVDVSPYQSYGAPRRIGLSSGIVSSYTPSDEAMFADTYFDGFYIYNDSHADASNVYLSITGGRSYEDGTEIIYEGSQFTNDITYLLDGKSRTSLYDQVRVSLLVSPTRELVKFNRDGSSPYFDLENQVFVPANQRVKIPDLSRGDFWGVYVRISTEFSPDVPHEEDYSFINLSYVKNNQRESYPGSVKTLSGVDTGYALPSVYFRFTTGYDSVIRQVNASVDRLYSMYPPYLLHYEDIPDED